MSDEIWGSSIEPCKGLIRDGEAVRNVCSDMQAALRNQLMSVQMLQIIKFLYCF
jgi:hypothetical protein